MKCYEENYTQFFFLSRVNNTCCRAQQCTTLILERQRQRQEDLRDPKGPGRLLHRRFQESRGYKEILSEKSFHVFKSSVL